VTAQRCGNPIILEEQKLRGMGKKWGFDSFGCDVPSIPASLKGKEAGHGKRRPNKQSRRIIAILPGNFKPIGGKITGLVKLGFPNVLVF